MSYMYIVFLSDNGVALTGVSPSWASFQKAIDGSAVASPSITEIGNGFYKFEYTSTCTVVGLLDGTNVLMDMDRYLPIVLTPHDEGLQFITDATAGAWRRVGTTLTLYKADNTTVIATFNLLDRYGMAADETTNVYQRKRA